MLYSLPFRHFNTGGKVGPENYIRVLQPQISRYLYLYALLFCFPFHANTTVRYPRAPRPLIYWAAVFQCLLASTSEGNTGELKHIPTLGDGIG